MIDKELFEKYYAIFSKIIKDPNRKKVSLGDYLNGEVNPKDDIGLLTQIYEIDVYFDGLLKFLSDSVNRGEMSNNDICITLGLYISAIKVKLAHPWTSEKAKCFFNYQLSKYENIKTLFEGAENVKKDKVKNVITGFKSNLSPKQIEALFDKLHGGGYIKTDIDTFKAIFKDEPLPLDFSIKWEKTNVLLSYFVKKLFHSNNFSPWKKAELIFKIENLRQSESMNDFPKGHKEIDNILNYIYTLLQ